MTKRFYLVRDGVRREDLELLAVAAPKIMMNRQASIKTSLSGRFQQLEGAKLLTDHIVCVLDGQNCGEFVVCGCVSHYDGDCVTWQIEAYDQAVLLSRKRLEQRFFAKAGSSYMELIQDFLTECGIFRLLADRCDEVLLCDRQWEMGTTYLDLVNELLEEMGFLPLWFDSDGYARLSAYCPLTVDNVEHIYRRGDCHLASDCSSEWDVFDAKNVFVAVADSPYLDESMVASASNDDPNSPISTVHLGRVMAEVMVLENVASQAALQAYAERVRDESMLSVEEVSFYTDLQIHQVGELLALEHPQLEGIYRETAWLMDFDEELMTHKGRRVSLL